MPSTMSKLYSAASSGSVERTLDLLSGGKTDIDLGCHDHGWTPLMVASEKGYLRIIRVLLRHGAGVSVKTDRGHTALHIAVACQHLAVTKVLIKSGADLEAKAGVVLTGPTIIQGHTAMHLAAGEGFCTGITALINAGAKIDSRLENGASPLYIAASCGKLQAVKILLRANANPLLTVGLNCAFDVAAQEGHLGVMQHLLERFGIDGCCRGRGICALEASAYMNHVDVLTFLLDSGAVDSNGTALCSAVEGRSEACIKLLVERRGGNPLMVERAYTNIDNGCDNPLLCSFDAGRGNAPRIAKFLLEHGADTASNVRFEIDGLGGIDDTPLVAAKLTLRHEQTHFDVKNSEGLDGLKGVIRLLQQERAVHANSWAWKADIKRATPNVRKLPAFKIRPGKPKVLLAAMDRYCKKEDGAFLGYDTDE